MLESRSKAAPYKAKMAAVLARYQLEDSIRLPVTLDPEHYALIGPLHDSSLNYAHIFIIYVITGLARSSLTPVDPV